jgi:hypothetical protein
MDATPLHHFADSLGVPLDIGFVGRDVGDCEEVPEFSQNFRLAILCEY